MRIQNLNDLDAPFNHFDMAVDARFLIDKGDLLFAWSGTPGTSFGTHIWNRGPAILNQHIYHIHFDETLLDKRFLRFAINSQLDYLIGLAHGGAGLAHVTKPMFEATEITLAPLAEQRRMVGKLDALLARVHAAQARLKTIPRVIQRFRQSVLAAACSGRLTADWRERAADVESTQSLIKRIKTIREIRYAEDRTIALASGRRQPPQYDNLEPSLRDDLELSSVPESWEWVDLRYLMDEREAFCYGVVQPGNDRVDGVPLIRVCDLENASVSLSNLRTISRTIHQQYQRSAVKGGEVIVSVVGTIGRAAIVPKECAGFNIARAVAKIPIKDFEPRYILLWLRSTTAEQWMIGDAREVARKTLNLEQLRTLPIPLPPILEQQEISRRVEALFKTADVLESRYRKAKAHVDRLTESILSRAFRGELVPQDPNDEPASVLLEKIHQERNGDGGKKAGRRK